MSTENGRVRRRGNEREIKEGVWRRGKKGGSAGRRREEKERRKEEEHPGEGREKETG